MKSEYKSLHHIYYSFDELTALFFENFSVSSITLAAKEKNDYFGNFKDNIFIPKLEARITEKAWKEVTTNFNGVKLGNYGFTEDTFTGIVTVDCRIIAENTKKFLPKVIASFKARSTILLNQFHGKHGRVFWENCFKEEPISDLNELNEVLKKIK